MEASSFSAKIQYCGLVVYIFMYIEIEEDYLNVVVEQFCHCIIAYLRKII